MLERLENVGTNLENRELHMSRLRQCYQIARRYIANKALPKLYYQR